MKPAVNSFRASTSGNVPSVSSRIDRFEQELRSNSDVKISVHFPAADDADYESVVSELLRVLLEYRWEQGERIGVAELLAKEELDWILERPRVLSPVAFEEYRLRRTYGLPADSETFQRRFGVDVTDWELWLNHPGAETSGVFSSTLSGYAETWEQSSGLERSQTSDGSSGGCQLWTSRGPELPEVGDCLGDFQLESLIGSGAFSRVFIARQVSLAKRQIVLKVTTTPLGESQQLARLQHGNIMPLYFAQAINGLYVLGMPFLGAVTLKAALAARFGGSGSGGPTGQVLADLLRQQRMGSAGQNAGPAERMPAWETESLILPFEKMRWEDCVLAIGQRLADALHFAHSRGIRHCDIKPANVLLGFDGQPFLLDFNLSRLERDADNLRPRAVGGTIPYMSPEHLDSMISGHDLLNRESDVYSLGVVLYEALTGQLPHRIPISIGANLDAARASRRQVIRNPRELNSAISPAAAAIVLKCLAEDTAQRYRSASDLSTDLRLQLADFPLRYASNPSLWETMGKFRRRNGWLFSVSTLAVIAVLTAILALIAALGWQQTQRASRAKEMYAEFFEKAHRAEAELFFAEGGAKDAGRRLAQEALSVFHLTGDVNGEPSTPLQWLEPKRKSEVLAAASLLGRLSIEEPLGLSSPLGAATPGTPLELAADAFMSRQYRRALGLLDSELERSFERFAVWFLKGKCHLELREYRDAERCFAVAGMVEPDSVMTLVARGTCCFYMNQLDDAQRHFMAALALDATNFAALYNLALIDERAARPESALAWLAKAEVAQHQSTRLLLTKSRIARSIGNHQVADELLSRVITADPTEPEGWVLRGLARLAQSPADAAADFAKAQAWSTTRFIAGQNRAHVLSEYLKRPAEAIEVLSELLTEDPEFLPGLSGRAVLYAREGRKEEALADAKRCTELAMTPQLHYQLACVYALLAEADESLKNRALHHLALATFPAYGADVIGSDEDLRNLRDASEFKAILHGIQVGVELKAPHDK